MKRNILFMGCYLNNCFKNNSCLVLIVVKKKKKKKKKDMFKS